MGIFSMDSSWETLTFLRYWSSCVRKFEKLLNSLCTMPHWNFVNYVRISSRAESHIALFLFLVLALFISEILCFGTKMIWKNVALFWFSIYILMSVFLKWKEVTFSEEKGVSNSLRYLTTLILWSYHIQGFAYRHILQILVLLNYKIFPHKRRRKLLEF